MKQWERLAHIVRAVRLVEQRIEAAEAEGRECPLILVRLAERMHAHLQRERLRWEGIE